jgi:hypothetical protein
MSYAKKTVTMAQALDGWLKTHIFKDMGQYVLPKLDSKLGWLPTRKPK